MGVDGIPEYAKIDPKTGQVTPPKERPMGVTILAMMYFIMAGVTAVQILVVIFWGLVDFEFGAICCAIPFFLVVLFYLSIGAGLFMMMRQFWFWALLLAILGLLFAIGNLVSTMTYSEWYPDGVPVYLYAIPAIQLVVNGIIVFYLFQVKDLFREIDPKQVQQMQIQSMEKQLEMMKKQQGEEPPTEDRKEIGGDSEGEE